MEGDNNWYEKKDYPHYSNAIKLVELPKPVQSVVDIEPMKTQCDCFTVEDNTIFKVGKVYEVVDALFKQSINYCNHLKKSLLTSSSYLREVANENYDLKVIADELNISFVTVKLVLEVLDNYYDLSMRIKGEEQKVKLC